MFYCEKCSNGDCCERTDLPNEPVLCDECYNREMDLLKQEDIKNLRMLEGIASDMLKTADTEEGKTFFESELVAIRRDLNQMTN